MGDETRTPRPSDADDLRVSSSPREMSTRVESATQRRRPFEFDFGQQEDEEPQRPSLEPRPTPTIGRATRRILDAKIRVPPPKPRRPR